MDNVNQLTEKMAITKTALKHLVVHKFALLYVTYTEYEEMSSPSFRPTQANIRMSSFSTASGFCSLVLRVVADDCDCMKCALKLLHTVRILSIFPTRISAHTKTALQHTQH